MSADAYSHIWHKLWCTHSCTQHVTYVHTHFQPPHMHVCIYKHVCRGGAKEISVFCHFSLFYCLPQTVFFLSSCSSSVSSLCLFVWSHWDYCSPMPINIEFCWKKCQMEDSQCSTDKHCYISREKIVGSNCVVHFSAWPWINFKNLRPMQAFLKLHFCLSNTCTKNWREVLKSFKWLVNKSYEDWQSLTLSHRSPKCLPPSSHKNRFTSCPSHWGGEEPWFCSYLAEELLLIVPPSASILSPSCYQKPS